MHGLSNSENIFDLKWPLKVKGQGQAPPPKKKKKKFRNTFIPVYNRYTHSKPTQKSGWSLAGCIGWCKMLSAATKLWRLALCAFIGGWRCKIVWGSRPTTAWDWRFKRVNSLGWWTKALVSILFYNYIVYYTLYVVIIPVCKYYTIVGKPIVKE